MKVSEYEVDQWLYHRGFAWKIAEVERERIDGTNWDTKMVLIREDLEQKEFLKKQGTWERGRATVTSILRVNSSEEFEPCETVDERQFDWQRRDDKKGAGDDEVTNPQTG